LTLAITLVAAPIVLALLIHGFRDPTRRLLPAYAALLPFGSGLGLPIAGLSASYRSLSSLAGLALTVALAVELLRQRTPARTERPAYFSPVAPVWLLLLTLFATSTLWSVTPGNTIEATLAVAGVIIIFLLLAVSDVDPVSVRRTESAAVVGGIVACCYGLYQAFTGTLPKEPVTGVARFGVDLVGHNHMAAALLLPLAVAFVRVAVGPSVRTRLLHTVAAMFLLSGIVLTGSRGGLIGAGIVLVVVLLVERRRAVLAAVSTVLAAAVLIVVLLSPDGIGQRQQNADDHGRADIWAVGVHSCQTYCLVGAGWGTFQEIYEQNQAATPDAKVLPSGTRWAPHNNWLMLTVETGIAGVALMMLGFILTLVEALLLPRRVRAGPLAALVAVIFTGYLLSNFEFKYFWFALVYVLLVQKTSEHGDDDLTALVETARGGSPAMRG
jgi:O-antigen ligase